MHAKGCSDLGTYLCKPLQSRYGFFKKNELEDFTLNKRRCKGKGAPPAADELKIKDTPENKTKVNKCSRKNQSCVARHSTQWHYMNVYTLEPYKD